MTDLPRVHRLSPRLANQIAAGEVVERPASVLKELLENSLDAGATRIRVEIEGGGSRLIRVVDDGCGIHRDDLELALSRHATSKIDRLADLERLASMGFRGEALASIASVSRCRLISRRRGEESGWAIELSGSERQGDVLPHAHPQGTTVEVRDLFFNTPARRRFLRSERTEQGHLEAVFKRIAMSRFEIAFSLRCGQRSVFRLPASPEGREQRVGKLCGKAFLHHARYLEFELSGMRLWGWLAEPEFARSQTDLQYFYLNGRTIRDRLVNHAIRQSFQECLYPGRHPAFVLFLEMPPEQVDVNVHPTKHEVRFREARLVHDFLVSSLQRALNGERMTEESPLPPLVPAGVRPGSSPGALGVSEQIAAYRELHEPAEPAADTPAEGRAVALLSRCHLLARYGEAYRLLDLHRGRQRLFEHLLDRNREEGIPSRPLLLPLQIALGERDGEVLDGCQEWFAGAGFEVDRIGPAAALIRRAPSALQGCDLEALFPALLSALRERELAHEGEFVALLAGQAARFIAGTPSLDQLQSLLRQLDALPEGVRKEFEAPLTEAALEGLFSACR